MATITNIKYIEDAKHIITGAEITFANGVTVTIDEDDFQTFHNIWNKHATRNDTMNMINEAVEAGNNEYDSPFDRPVDQTLADNPKFIEAMCEAYDNGYALGQGEDTTSDIINESITECMDSTLADFVPITFDDL